MKFKRLAAAVMAATMCGSLFVGCGNAKKDDTAAGEEKITATIKVWGCAEDQADENGKWLQTMCDQFNSEHPDFRHLLMLMLLQSLVERQQIMLRKLTQMQLWIQYQ